MLEIQFHETKRNTIVQPELCFQTSRKNKRTCNALSYRLGLPEVWDLLLWGSGSDKNMKGTCRGDLIYHFKMNLSCIMSLWLSVTGRIALSINFCDCYSSTFTAVCVTDCFRFSPGFYSYAQWTCLTIPLLFSLWTPQM